MNRRPAVFVLAVLAVIGWIAGAKGDEPRPGVPLLISRRDFIFRSGVDYVNYAFEDYEIPEKALIPHFERRNYYGPLGHHLIDGYDVFSWSEVRTNVQAGRIPRSEIQKSGRYNLFQRNIVAYEGYGNWAARLIIGDEIRTFFTPLTLYKAGINGLRLDVETQHTRSSFVASRYRDPIWRGGIARPRPRDSSLLLAGHTERILGALAVGLTGVHFHLFDGQQEDFTLRGSLESTQTLPSFLIVRFADDSPEDERGGAVIARTRLKINGVYRDDIQPLIVRLDSRNPTAVGVISRVTGQFTRTPYPDRGTRYADVFYLQRHLAGENVSSNVNLSELVRYLEFQLPGEQLRADGYEVIEFFYDLSDEPYISRIQVEALVGNDYRIEVFGLAEYNPVATREEGRWTLSGLEGRRRAAGNLQDLSNLEWVTMDVGVWTGRSVFSVNGKWEAYGGRIRWEYARSLDYRQYPDGRPERRLSNEMEGVRQWNGNRSFTKDASYYLTGEWHGDRLSAGGELFSIGPEFTRELMGTPAGEVAPGVEITDGFVEDNDDNDRWPDRGPGVRGGHSGAVNYDPSGVFPGQTEDGIPITNRNQNELPDYVEPFLQFYVEPNEYFYGRDWNHNGVADEREDDLEPDYPYQQDQRGTHLFGKIGLPWGFSFTAGRLRAKGIASGGLNESTYAILQFERKWASGTSIEIEHLVERVKDDIENPYVSHQETLSQPRSDGPFHSPGSRVYDRIVINDPLEWRNSLDRKHYLAGEWRPLPNLQLSGNLRHAVNYQLEGTLADGTDQRKDELTLTSAVTKFEYAWQPHPRWQVIVQSKGLWLRRRRDSLPVDLQSEWTLFPILKAHCRLTPRTELRMGTQGLPGLPLRRKDLADGWNSMKESVRIIELSNRSSYFGYEISTNIGLKKTLRYYDLRSRSKDDLDITGGYMRVFLGYH